MIGQTISHYKILEKLGEGGMGVVYKALDTKLERMVALKFLPAHLSASEADKARFIQEARAAAALNHPNVCSVIDITEHDGTMFIVMEFVEGKTLRQMIPVQKLADAMSYALQTGEALQEAHSKQIVHRDIKSDNIMITRKNLVKVMDFGLAKLKGSLKLTKASSTVGTLAYMAPEQIQGADVDARSDIFSFGVVLFEMLTGKLPFRGEHDASLMYSILNEEPESILKQKPDLPPELDRIVTRALEKDPEDRYQSVADMVSELRREQKKSGRVARSSVSGAAPGGPQSSRTMSPVADATAETTPQAMPVPSSRKKVLARAAAGLAVVLVVVSAYLLFSGRKQAIDSLAVLPFENVGGGADLDYLSDGITESIINNLSKISLLRVVPRSTVFRFKGKNMDVQDVGSKLKVRAVLAGKITTRGDALEVQVDLIDIAHESQLWGDRYQSNAADLLSVQERITNDVSSRLGIGLTAETREKMTKRYTDNTQAYQLYLQGRYYWNKRTAAALERAVDYFKQAIALDSTYALAYSGLADCYIIQSQYSGTPTSITLPLTQQAARRALELDNSLAETHTSLAFSYFEEWKYDDAEREFKQSISLNPKYPTTYHWYNILLLRTGRIDEAAAIIQKGYDLDPFSPIITLNYGAIPFRRGQLEEALPYFRKCTELDPSFAVGYAWAGLTLERMKKPAEAIPLLQKAVELSGRSSECLSYLGYVYGRAGRRDEVLALLKENEGRYRAGTGAAYNIARIYAGLGDKAKVLEWLEQDCRDRSTWINALLEDYCWNDVRSDPRFVDLVKKVGLAK